MADLTKSLLKAISIIADKTVEEVSSDKTIKVTIKKVISTSEGKYLVNYNSGDFYVYVQSGSTDLYQIGEQVYVLVPEGDMSQKKFILGRANDDEEELSSSKVLQSSLLNDYVMIGDNAVVANKYRPEGRAYVKKMQPLPLNSHVVSDFYYCYLKDPKTVDGLPKKNNKYIYDTLEYPSVSIDEEAFSNSAKQAEALLIRAKFKASLDTERAGNYGVIVNVAFADDTNPQTDKNGNVTYPPRLIAYVLDTSKMTGNPMKFYDYTSQYMVAPFDGEKYLYIDSIIAFSEGFVEQNTEAHDSNDDINIYMDGLEVVALDEISAVNGDYKLKLTTPRGSTIKAGERDSLKITATMTYLDQEIADNVVFYWGMKDPSVTSAHDEYNAKLGSGYRYLKEESGKELILPPSKLTAAENTIICVGIYKKDIILKTSLSLFNNNNKIDISIESDQGVVFQFNEGNPTLTCLINGRSNNYQENYPDEAFSFIWSKEDVEIGSVLLDATESQLEIDKQKELEQCNTNPDRISNAGRTAVQVLSYYSTRIAQVKNITYPNGVHGPQIQCKTKNANTSITYSCSVYRGDVYIGYGSITLQNSKTVVNNNYYITITNGSQVFQYDESGIAPDNEKHKEPIEVLDLTAVFHSPQGGEVTPKKVRWIVPEDKTLINLPYLGLETDPETGEKYFLGDTFPLNIKEVYDNTSINNQLVAVVTHADGTEYRQSTNLLFTKVGEIGTNGTGTVVKINETIAVPQDELLTMIKPKDRAAFYNGGYPETSAILEASLYTNNTQVAGHKTDWKIAGQSTNKQSYSYNVETDDNACTVTHDGSEKGYDTRIVKAQVSFKGKYFSSFYGIPAIEYSNEDYNYNNYKIKVMRDGTLTDILYDSNGMNPTYNQTQGAHVELVDWDETGYLEWTVESGPKIDGVYENPNLLLSRSPKAKSGSTHLRVDYDTENAQALILRVQDTAKACANNATANIKSYIEQFITDVEKVGADNLMSISDKLDVLWNRLDSFSKKAPDSKNVYIKTVYQEYTVLFNRITNEYNSSRDTNKESTKIYEEVRAIWNSKWPDAITSRRLCTKPLSGIKTIQQLINKYQRAYDDRSNNAENAMPMPVRKDTFNDVEGGPQFLTLLNEKIDTYYDEYVTSLGNEAVWIHPDLVEYSKILVAYLSLLVDETQACFEGSYFYTNADGESKNLYAEISSRYALAYEDWATKSNENDRHEIGKNIYDAALTANGIIANIYDNVRGLHRYYQSLYSNVKKYQIAEDSRTLYAWSALLNGEKPDLLKQIYVIPTEAFDGLYMNNNIVGTAYVKNDNKKIEIAKIYIPIIMTLNTYELSSLNGWDGTSIDIGDGYITTPQIGAGIKDDTTNTFTGMVMGAIDNLSIDPKKEFKFKDVNKVGLIGFAGGKQSLFIDSETGRAYFGLPEDDTATEDGTNEGRIELIPGGVSKIGNWKIGSRFLYNIVDGNYERRTDKDSRSGSMVTKLMVPHDKHGIILSSDQPYIHIKGEVYEDNNLKGINYKDEYNDINPGDSLELRLDPGNKSLFSIIQHTVGFGDEQDNTLFFGYNASNPDSSIRVIKNYTPNKNTGASVEYGDGAEYYIYSLVTDMQGNYMPFYRQQDDSGLTKVTGAWNPRTEGTSSSWNETSFSGYNSDLIYLKDFLPENNFKRTDGTAPVFSINHDTGTITYNPDNLIWSNGIKGFSNEDGWQSVTGRVLSKSNFTINLKYNRNIDTPIDKDTFKIGKFRNNTKYDIYKVTFNCTMSQELTKIMFNSWSEAYIQFYVVADENDGFNKALLRSEQLSLKDNLNNSDIELLSYEENKLARDTVYCLKMKVYVDSYSVNSDHSYLIKSIPAYYKAPITPEYGTIEIKEQKTGAVSFTTSSESGKRISGLYEIYNESGQRRIRFKINGSQTYDFVLWRKGDTNVTAGGRTILNKYSKFFTSQETTLENLKEYAALSNAPTQDNPWCISFYQAGFCTTEKTVYASSTSTEGISDVEEDGSLSIDTTEEILKYVFDGIDIIENSTYTIDWSSVNYNTIAASWALKFIDLKFGALLGFIPYDITTLCIEDGNTANSIQGIPYSKTYWENGVQKVLFYKDYYDWVNINQKAITQYGYINVVGNGNAVPTYYKYIKTLTEKNVNGWFVNESLPDESFTAGEKYYGVRTWVAAPVSSKAFKDAIYWKEFIRVGLDENGRLFSAGTQDKRTYGRTGRLHAFGKVIDLYGQEVKVQSNQDNYLPIVKIFAQTTNTTTAKTTYITQGQDDDGNISIRTAKNGYIELAASESQTNEFNEIPIATHTVKVNYKEGISLQSADNIINLKQNGLSINTNDMIVTDSDATVSYQITKDYSWTKTPNFVISSVAARSAADALRKNLNVFGDNTAGGHYRIQAFSDGITPTIKLQVGKDQVGANITHETITLKSRSKRYIEITNQDEGSGCFYVDGMKLLFQNNNVELSNGSGSIGIFSDPEHASYKYVSLSYRNGGNIKIDNTVTVNGKNGLVVADGDGKFKKRVITNDSIYAANGIHIGYDIENRTRNNGGLYLYSEDNSKILVLGKHLKQLFDWYNKNRWAIGTYGNTVWLRNVSRRANPEGEYKYGKYYWNYQTFNGY